MNISTLTKTILLPSVAALTLSACSVSVDNGNGGGITPPPPPPVKTVQPSNISLSPGVFYGANGIRARVARSGRGYTVQNLTGKNGPKDYYADQGGNRYKGPSNFYIQVESSKRFKWKGVHGFKIMHDDRKDAR
ncbi:MAG: hypothetical protein ABJO57_13010 [Lentilitoribacter sp.]